MISVLQLNLLTLLLPLLSGYMTIPVGKRSELVKTTEFSNNRPIMREDGSTSRLFLSLLLCSVVVQAVAKTLKQLCR